MKDVKDAREKVTVKSFERQVQILFMNSSSKSGVKLLVDSQTICNWNRAQALLSCQEIFQIKMCQQNMVLQLIRKS